MRSEFRKKSNVFPVLLMVLGVGLAMALMVAYPESSQVGTIFLSFLTIILVFSHPLYGLVVVMALLYLPVFSVLSFGSLEFSVTSLPVALLAVVAVLRRREQGSQTNWKGWQATLMILLGMGFFIAVILSADLSISLLAVPNLIIYLLILFSINSLVTEQKDITLLAKATVILAFISIIWKEVDGLVGLPRLSGINGINFTHHVALALCFSVWMLPIKEFSNRWKIFMALVAISIAVDFVYYETRAAWITGIIMFALIIWRARPAYLLVGSIVGVIGIGIIITIFGVIVQRNLIETQSTMAVLQGAGLNTANPDDQIRLVAQQAGLNMIHARPWFGWGPNLFGSLKGEFVNADNKTLTGNAFSAWITSMAEMGILGTLPVILAFIVPFLIILRYTGRRNSNFVAYALSVGVIGLVIHLFFLSMLYSFAWFNVGLSWAAAGIVSKTKVDN